MYVMKFSDFQTDKVEKLKLASLFLWLIGAGHSVKSFSFCILIISHKLCKMIKMLSSPLVTVRRLRKE
jgi:hypothetical protein